MLAEVYERASEFDVIHSHIDVWTLPFAERSATPSVLTMHGRLDTDYVQAILPLYPEIPLVSVSDSQREPVVSIGCAGRRPCTTASTWVATELSPGAPRTSWRSWGG